MPITKEDRIKTMMSSVIIFAINEDIEKSLMKTKCTINVRTAVDNPINKLFTNPYC